MYFIFFGHLKKIMNFSSEKQNINNETTHAEIIQINPKRSIIPRHKDITSLETFPAVTAQKGKTFPPFSASSRLEHVKVAEILTRLNLRRAA